jgi:hypothetical protein
MPGRKPPSRHVDDPLLFLREDTDTATPRTPIPLYFIHTLTAPFCQDTHCLCHGSIQTVTRLFGEAVEGMVVLESVAALTEQTHPVRAVSIETIDGIPEACQLYGHSWEVGRFPGEKVCSLCSIHGYCPSCGGTPPPDAQPFLCTRHSKRQVQ